MTDHLSPIEKARLSKLDALLTDLAAKAAPLKAERDRLLLLDRQRRFRARKAK